MEFIFRIIHNKGGKMGRKGFTLIELIVVIAIIAILASIIAPNAFRAIEKAKISATVEDFRSIKTGAMAYYADTGTWPADCPGPGACTALVTNDAANGWDGPYLEKWPPAAKWAGIYLLRRAADSNAIVGGYDWDGAAATPDVRVVSISNVPGATAYSATTAAGRIDVNFDGPVAAGNTLGSVRYALTNPTTVYILVSRD